MIYAYYRLKRTARRLGLFCLVSVLVSAMIVNVAFAQQVDGAGTIASARKADGPVTPVAKPGGDAKTDTSIPPNMKELLQTIKRLEERVKELESKVDKPPLNVADIAANAGSVKAVKSAESASAAPAQGKDSKADDDKKNAPFLAFFRNTEVSGFVDVYYGYNFNKPGGDAQLRNFDTKHNSFSLNLAEIALEKKVSADSRLGYRVDLNFGPATEFVHASEPGGSEVFKHTQQAYLSALAPAGKGLQIDVGKFVTQHGAEVIETKDNWNYSRSLLFTLAIPYYHFGVRATYPFSDKFSLSGYLVNGWNNSVDNNTGKTFGIQAVIKPTSKLTLVQNYMGGPEQAGNNDDWRHLWDTTLTVDATSTLSLMANYDYGFDRVGGAKVHWQGLAAYARFHPNKWFALAPRFEWYDDHDGFTTGVRQTVKEFTMTSEHKINGGLLTRLEYRRDFSDRDFFLRPVNRLVQAQSTVTFGLVYAFSSKGE